MLGIPHVAHGARTVALERVGDCEISMFEALGASLPEAPLFWIELFDLRIHSSVDSCGCYSLDEAAVVFADFASRAIGLTEASQRATGETEG